MAALTASPATLSASVRVMGAGFTPPVVRHCGQQPETASVSLTIGGGFAGVATLAVVGSASWITLPTPAEASDGVAVTIGIDASDLTGGQYADVIRATKDGFDSIDVPIGVLVVPGGGKPGKPPR